MDKTYTIYINLVSEDIINEKGNSPVADETKLHLNYIAKKVYKDQSVKLVYFNDIGNSINAFKVSDYDAFITVNNLKSISDNNYKSILDTIILSEKKRTLFVLNTDKEGVKDPYILDNYYIFSLFNYKNQKLIGAAYWYCYFDLFNEIGQHLFFDIKDRKTVFLAEVSPEQFAIRQSIKRELIQLGCRILPDKPLSVNASDAGKEIRAYLQKAVLAIHILDDTYNENHHRPYPEVALQNKIASDCVVDKTAIIPRIIWYPLEGNNYNENQRLKFERFKRTAQNLAGAELIQVQVEKLKEIVERYLYKSVSIEIEEEGAKKTKIYLLHDAFDYKQSQEVKELLAEQGFEVLLSNYDHSQVQLLELHRRNLAQCDAALICYTLPNERWLRMKVLDLVKAPGYGRKKPLLAKLILKDKSLSFSDDDLDISDVTVIDKEGNLTKETLAPFLLKLRSYE